MVFKYISPGCESYGINLGVIYPYKSERMKMVESKSSDRSDLEGLVMAVYDVIECVQQLLWLIVTADPKNTFGKKAKFDSTPFELLIRSLKLSLKTMTKSWISATVLVSEFGRYQSLVPKKDKQ